MSFTTSVNRNSLRHNKLSLLARRKQLIELVRKHPDWHQDELAAAMKVNKSTISRDLKAINEEFNVTNQEGWLLHRDRVLKEIKDRKDECLRRLDGCTKPHQGARWMEEWTKLMIQEARILGINSPSHVMIQQETAINKEEKDAAINAAFKQISEDVITIAEDGKIMLPESTVVSEGDNGDRS